MVEPLRRHGQEYVALVYTRWKPEIVTTHLRPRDPESSQLDAAEKRRSVGVDEMVLVAKTVSYDRL